MYGLASALAFKKGPREQIVNGKMTAAYILTRDELALLFLEHHYNIRRSTWLRCIQDWEYYFNVAVPAEAKKPELTKWSIMFGMVDKEHFAELRRYAEDKNCFRFPDFPEGVSA